VASAQYYRMWQEYKIKTNYNIIFSEIVVTDVTSVKQIDSNVNNFTRGTYEAAWCLVNVCLPHSWTS